MSTIEIRNLVLYKVNQQRHSTTKYVPLIKNLNATFEAGKINAIMGPNGSSKTTLLNILYGTCEPSAKTSGSILYNGAERNMDEWFNSVSYSEQDWYAIEDQTVLEAIRFSLNLHRASSNESEKSSEEKLKELIKHLQLEKVADSKINVVSGGERKRTMMAIEMVMGRKILILDEPTSDLDSHLAYNVTKYLKDLAVRENLIVIMTVHQPSPQLFNIFDNFFFMYKGMQVYNGPVSDIVETMRSRGIVQPESWTTAEFLFEAFGEMSSFENIEALRPQINKYIEELDSAWKQNHTELYTKNDARRYGSINIGHVWLLAKRQFLRDLRSMHTISRIFTIVIVQMIYVYIILKSDVELPSNTDGTMIPIPNPLDSSDSKALCLLASSILTMVEGWKLFYLLMDGSTTFAAKPQQLSKEISKNFYSLLSLCISTMAVEIVSNLATVAIVLAGIAALGTRVVTIHLVMMLLCQAILFVPTSLLVRLLHIKISEFNSIAGIIFAIVKVFFSSIGFSVMLPMLLGAYLPKLMVVARGLAWVIISLCPVHLMDLFIMMSFENKVVKEVFDGNSNSSTSSFTKSIAPTISFLTNGAEVDSKWLLGGSILSLSLIAVFIPVIFILYFNPQVRLRMNKE